MNISETIKENEIIERIGKLQNELKVDDYWDHSILCDKLTTLCNLYIILRTQYETDESGNTYSISDADCNRLTKIVEHLHEASTLFRECWEDWKCFE